jgi:hypothetical protein
VPAKIKTTDKTQAVLERLFAARDAWEQNDRVFPPSGMELTQRHGDEQHGYEEQVWVFRRTERVAETIRSEKTEAAALWATLPKAERRRSRLFAHCVECPVRFTKKGAIADALRHDEARGRYMPPSPKERLAAELRSKTEPPELVPRDFEERAMLEVWHELTPLQRRTLHAVHRPARPGREWALEGAPSPEAFRSRVRSAERALARALAARFLPDVDFSVKTRGRRGFDYDRFWLYAWDEVEPDEVMTKLARVSSLG